MRDLQLTIEPRPTGPGPYTFAPEPEAAPPKWREALVFAGAVAIGACVIVGRLMLKRPFATVTLGAFLVGAVAVAANFWAQPRQHPAPLFQRAATTPALETTATIPRREDPIARLAAEPPPPPAQPRERREIVRDLQQELARRGLYDGAVDGRFGPRTQAAIRAFEQQAGLPQTGEPTERLLERARVPQTAPAARAAPAQAQAQPQPQRQAAAPAAPAADPARSHAIVHRRLAEMGYAPGRPAPEATPEFRRAVERFQRDNDLPPTGQVDQRFLDRMAAVTGPLR